MAEGFGRLFISHLIVSSVLALLYAALLHILLEIIQRRVEIRGHAQHSPPQGAGPPSLARLDLRRLEPGNRLAVLGNNDFFAGPKRVDEFR